MENLLIIGTISVVAGALIYALYSMFKGEGCSCSAPTTVDTGDTTLLAAGMQDPMLGVAAYTAGTAARKATRRQRKCPKCRRTFYEGEGCDCGYDGDGLDMDYVFGPLAVSLDEFVSDPIHPHTPDGTPDTDGYQGAPPSHQHYTEPSAPAEPTPVFSHHEYSAPEPSHNSSHHDGGFSHSDYGSSSSYSDSGSSSSSCDSGGGGCGGD
jgi:hypothetical protein